MELKELFEPIVKFIKNLQNKDKENSKDEAKKRLQLVLMQDRASVSPDFFEMMKKEIIDVIKKYIEIDEEALEVQLTRGCEDGLEGPALYANIPIKNIKPVAKKVENEEEALSQDEEEEIEIVDEVIEEEENANQEASEVKEAEKETSQENNENEKSDDVKTEEEATSNNEKQQKEASSDEEKAESEEPKDEKKQAKTEEKEVQEKEETKVKKPRAKSTKGKSTTSKAKSK